MTAKPDGTEAPQLAFQSVRLVERSGKPRTTGITYARDRGLGLKALDAALESTSPYIDILKLSSFIPRLQPRDGWRACADAGAGRASGLC